MTTLRHRLLDDMPLPSDAPSPSTGVLCRVAPCAPHCGTSPDRGGPADLHGGHARWRAQALSWMEDLS